MGKIPKTTPEEAARHRQHRERARQLIEQARAGADQKSADEKTER